ncbi:MAG: glycosyltransferase family 4 protein [Anaerolineae bacterium]|nr:glycosyltransferase family 4 protein [Anaerolineae bacterium]
MRIGYDARILAAPLRGMARYTVGLLRALRAVAPEHAYILYTDRPLHAEIPPGITVRELPPARLWATRTLRQAACADQLDLVHFPANSCWLRPACPTVVTLHDVNPLSDGTYSWKLRLYYLTYLAVMSYAARAVITDSHASAAAIVRRVPPLKQRLHTIHLGIELRPEPAAFQPADVGLPPDFVLFVGGCDPNKNVLTVIQSLARMTGSSAHLAVVGSCDDTAYSRDVQVAVKHLGLADRIHFLGRVEEDILVGLYKYARLYVYPSFQEGFGFPILEAMRFGTPVITANRSSMPEIAGDAALLVAPDDVAGLTDAMQRVLTDRALAADLRRRGVVRAAEFDWKRTAQQTLAVYEQILRQAGPKNQ